MKKFVFYQIFSTDKCMKLTYKCNIKSSTCSNITLLSICAMNSINTNHWYYYNWDNWNKQSV